MWARTLSSFTGAQPAWAQPPFCENPQNGKQRLTAEEAGLAQSIAILQLLAQSEDIEL